MAVLRRSLLREQRQAAFRARRWPPSSALVLFLLTGAVAVLMAQIPKSAAPKAEPAAPLDPLRRETPRSAVDGLLRCGEREDFACMSRYLQPTPGLNLD